MLHHNPASFGTMETYSANSTMRIQWDGVQDAPRTLNVNTGGRVRVGPRSCYNCGKEFRLGLNYQYGVVGFQRNHEWKFAIGYPIKMGESTLTVSVAPGIIKTKFAPSWVPPQTAQDSLLPIATAGSSFDMNAGLMFNWKTLYAGFSTTHLLAPNMSEINFSLARHYYLDFGYKIPVGKHHIFPMLQLKSDGAGAVFQTFSYFVFKEDLFSVGLGYRLADALSIGAAFQKWGVRIAYHYDYMLNPLSNYGKGSHEFRLSYVLPLKK